VKQTKQKWPACEVALPYLTNRMHPLANTTETQVQRPSIGTEGTFGLCELYRAAKAHRSLVLGKLAIRTIHAGGAIVRQAIARYRQRQQARNLHVALHQLDDRILRDLGINRSEITSFAAELTGQAECTRVRVPAPMRS
jgi:uncharacterized protein YjiS (DUF1127 family)